jgi:chromosome segregation ATPase
MADSVTTGEAARQLGTTPPTVRSLLARGLLVGKQERRGSRFQWWVDAASVNAYLHEHGAFRRQRRESRIDRLEAELDALRATVDSQGSSGPPKNQDTATERERDDLRAAVVALRDALAYAHSVAELQREAEAERASMVEHLQAAVAAGERADALRRRALTELEQALAGASIPGHLGL